jgi:hypothetical protein
MTRWMAIAAVAVSASSLLAQSPAPRPKFDAFEVATVKPVDPEPNGGRYIKMQGTNRFVEKAYTLQLLIAAAYDLNPKTISGGPPWLNSDHYDILAVTPGEVQPTHDEQMSMLRNLLSDMTNFVSLLQRAILDRPVVDKTGLSGRYDFDLEWAPDETQFGGGLPPASEGSQSPPLFEAIQQQLGLKLEATRGPVSALVVDKVERPSAN